MKNYLITLFLLNSFFLSTWAVSDENICDQQCQFCCREKQCKSESECKGNYQPFIILGAVAGGLIALFVARRVWVYYRNKQRIAQGKEAKKPKKSFLAARRRKESKSPKKEPKEKKERVKKSKSSSSKPTSVKSLKETDNMNKSKGDIYLQIDDGSVLSAEEIKSVKNKTNGNVSSRNELKPSSKNDISKNDKTIDKDRLNPYKQNKPLMENFKPSDSKDKKKDDKSKSSSTKKPQSGMKDSVNKERGRSRDASAKERASSANKKSTSTTANNKSRGNSSGARRNQV